MFDDASPATGFQGRAFIDDAWGGLAAMLVALPSAIAFGATIYAPLGGDLAAQGALAGILGATALGIVCSLFGGSTRLISAPCAPAAAVLSALSVGFVQQGIPAPAILLMLALIGLMAGLIQIGLGLARIGQLIKFIPYPVVSGYMSGVGLIIIGSQVPKLLGSPRGTGLLAALQNPSQWAWQGIVVGLVVVAAMVTTPRYTRSVPAAILALIAGVLVYLGMGRLDPALMNIDNNPLLIGTLSGGEGNLAESVTAHWTAMRGIGADVFVKILVPALTLAVLLSIDTLKTCLVIDALTNSHHNSNQELIGQGLGNITSAMIGGVPGSGTMGASMINISSGGTTKASGLMAGLLSLIAYFVLSPLVAWVPVSALAAILIVIGYRMIDRHSLAFFFTPSTRFDFLVILSVILVALFGDLIAASGVGVALAILLFIREQTRASIVRSRVEGHDIFSRRAHSSQEKAFLDQESGNVVILELQGSLFFGTASQLHAALEAETSRKYVILSMRRVQSLDVTATHVLEQIKDRLEEHDGFLVFCDIPKGLPSGLKMKRFLKETGVVRPTNKAFAFRQLDEALEWVESQMMLERAESFHQDPIDLPDMDIVSGCSQESIAALGACVQMRSVKAGKKIYKAGTDGSEMFLIRNGLVKLTMPIGKKTNYHLATSGPGEIIGGTGFVDGAPHSADALALTDVDVYVLTRENFRALSKQHSDVALAIVQSLARTLSVRLQITIGELQALRG